MKIAGLCLRIVVAWLLVMQPMFGAHASARMANAPFAAQLCRGGPAPSADIAGDIPGQPERDHSDCCMSCALVAAPPPRDMAIRTPIPAIAERPAVHPGHAPVTQAGLGPQSARAPPL
jgi:hypothetical protein